MERWYGRVALVTGASSGIGAAICRELLQHGMNVLGCARSVDKIKCIADEPKVKSASGKLYPMKCDLTKESDIVAVFDYLRKQFGRVDVCINCAGLAIECPMLKAKTEDWRQMMEVNVMALCICTRETVQLMNDKNIDDGQIINFSSVAGRVILDFDIGFYGGTKSMVDSLTEAFRKELRKGNSHIRICSISPGLVETEFVMNMTKGSVEKNDLYYKSLQSLQAEDMAAAVTSVLRTPVHVDINDILVRPTEQKF